MAESPIVRTKRDGIITITDGTRTYVVAYEPGNFSVDFPLEEVLNFLDRGVIGTTPSLRLGDDKPMTGAFSSYLRDIMDTAGSPTYTTLMDLAVVPTGRYVASNWTSTLGSSSDVKTWTIQFTIDGTFAGESDKTMSLTFVVLRAKMSEGDPDMVEISFTSYQVRPTFA